VLVREDEGKPPDEPTMELVEDRKEEEFVDEPERGFADETGVKPVDAPEAALVEELGDNAATEVEPDVKITAEALVGGTGGELVDEPILELVVVTVERPEGEGIAELEQALEDETAGEALIKTEGKFEDNPLVELVVVTAEEPKEEEIVAELGDTLVDETAEEEVDELEDWPLKELAEKAVTKVDPGVDMLVEALVGKPGDKPVVKAVIEVVFVTVEKPKEDVDIAAFEGTLIGEAAEETVNEPEDGPVEELNVVKPVIEVEAAVDAVEEGLADDTESVLADEPTTELIVVTVENPEEEVTAEPEETIVDETAEETTDEPIADICEDPIDEPLGGLIGTPVEELKREPIDGSRGVLVDKLADELIELEVETLVWLVSVKKPDEELINVVGVEVKGAIDEATVAESEEEPGDATEGDEPGDELMIDDRVVVDPKKALVGTPEEDCAAEEDVVPDSGVEAVEDDFNEGVTRRSRRRERRRKARRACGF